LGIDQPAGSRIQSYSLTVNYSPAASIQSVTFTRAGITQPLTPLFEASPSAPGSISLLDTFQEATNLIPFTSNAPLPGNQVAHLLFTFAPGTPAGTTVTLTLDPTLTQLSNDAGTTNETVTNARLTLVNGAITLGGTDLGIAKTAMGGPTYFAGQTVTYNIAVSNAGPLTANAVSVTDTIPAGAAFVSATSSQGSCSGTSTVTCALGAIANGATATISLRLTPASAGSLSNTATVSDASLPDTNNVNNSSTATIAVQPASNIPALNAWMLVLLAAALALIAFIRA
ncbi:MAG TPA: DUF11 domain-containing protein, partial [Thermoanaerobaculia bacterium]|nr:DUF11 domain-containing protein [Thermoanaerobaculia bacterium]